MSKTIKNRIEGLEQSNPDRPMIAIYQDWDDKNLWRPGNRKADPMTWNEAEKKYSDHVIFKVTHTENWRGQDGN